MNEKLKSRLHLKSKYEFLIYMSFNISAQFVFGFD